MSVAAKTCLCTVLQMNCAMIRFVFLLSSGDSEYVYMYIGCTIHMYSGITSGRVYSGRVYRLYVTLSLSEP